MYRLLRDCLWGLLLLSVLTGCTHRKSDSLAGSEPVKVGAKVLLDNYLDRLQGRRVGLVMNPTARVDDVHMVDTLLSRGIDVVALFAPEHGIRGEFGAGETIEGGIDRATGLPVYSLYGKVRKPTAGMLEQVDLILFDVQDVGARFYTYNTTLGLVIEAASEQEIPVWILDRPNPAGGDYVAGWILEDQYRSFIGAYPVPVVHGLTLGEMAKMMVGEKWITPATENPIRVIPMEGWDRRMLWHETGLEWLPPSPNLPRFENAYAYLGTALIEGTNLSEGRGTTEPFLMLGSPQTDIPEEALQDLNDRFPAASFNTTSFVPLSLPGKVTRPKHMDRTCYGLEIRIRSYKNLDPLKMGLEVLRVLMEYTEGAETKEYLFQLAGSMDVLEYRANWEEEVEQFKKRRQPYLIYP